jgi:hypothetical protein
MSRLSRGKIQLRQMIAQKMTQADQKVIQFPTAQKGATR